MAPLSEIPQPTNAELEKILSLVPTTQQPEPALEEALAELLAACRFPAALDFLINPESDPLSVLTSPVNRHAAVASNVSICSLAPTGFPKDSPLDFYGQYIFIPAFSIGDVQLGFGIRDCQSQVDGVRVDHPCSPVSRPNVFRFLRNDSAHVLVLVQDFAEPLVKIEYMRLLSGGTRRRHFIVVTRSGLHALHRSHSTIQPSQLAPHIIVQRSSLERRECPMCGNRPDSAPCFCVINVPKPRHALDFSIMAPGMTAHLGSYDGTAVVTFALQGLNMRSATVNNRMVISEVVDQDLVDRLSRCIISEELSKSPLSPLKDVLLRSVEQPTISSKEQTSSKADGSSSSSSSVRSLTVSDSAPVVLSPSQTSALLRAFCEPYTRSSSVQSDPTVDGNIQSSNPIVLDATLNNVSQLLHPTSVSLCAPTEPSNNEPWIPTQFPSVFQESLVSPITGPELPISSPGPTDEDLVLTDLIAEQAMNQYANENSDVPKNNAYRHEPVAIAPAMPFLASKDSKPKTQDERERRAELRRQRNREAAQRSNMRRKIKNDTLKSDLKKWHGKATELRRIEVALREENLKLRKQLSES